MAEQDLRKEKEVEYYSAVVNAWFGTRLEHDRSLLTLSAAGTGLLITLLSTIGARSLCTVLLYSGALASFLICLAAILLIFRRNATHLQEIIQNGIEHDPILRTLDVIAYGSFFLGVVLSSMIGIVAAVQSL